MSDYVFIQREHHDFHSFISLQMMRACCCTLEKWEFTDLSAPFWRWYRNDCGGAFVIMHKKRIQLIPDRIYLIPPHTVFGSGNSRPVKQLYLHFSLDVQTVRDSMTLFSHAASPREVQLIDELTCALKKGETATKMEISWLSQSLAHLALTAIPNTYWESLQHDSRVEQAVCTIKKNAPIAIGNPALAREANMNVNAFTRLFKKIMGDTPHQYLIRLRMEAVCKKLLYSDESLEHIADQTGFCDRFHLSRVFKKHFDISPVDFRRQARRLS